MTPDDENQGDGFDPAASPQPPSTEAAAPLGAEPEDDAGAASDEGEAALEEAPEEGEPARPAPPSLPARRDPNLESLKTGPTEAEQERLRRAHATPAFIPLDAVDEDTSYQVREPGDPHHLATDIARLGQLYPVDVRPRGEGRYQVVSGFRRVAALRFLQRDRVLARVHDQLSDDDALLMSLAAAIHSEPVAAEELAAAKERWEAEGKLSAAARDMLDKALAAEELAPEGVEEEVDADELADDVTARLGEINQDLALLADVFSQLDEGRKTELLKQLGYSAELVAYLEGR